MEDAMKKNPERAKKIKDANITREDNTEFAASEDDNNNEDNEIKEDNPGKKERKEDEGNGKNNKMK